MDIFSQNDWKILRCLGGQFKAKNDLHQLEYLNNNEIKRNLKKGKPLTIT